MILVNPKGRTLCVGAPAALLPERNQSMDKQKAIDKLNEILKHEWTGLAQYAQQAFLVRGLWREPYAKMFFESAEECFRHAKLIGEKIVALGGVPTLERGTVQQSTDVRQMLQHALAFEQAAVEHYRQALEICAEDRPLVVLLEDLILEEQQGVDELQKLLQEHAAAEASLGPQQAQERAG